MRWGCGPSSCGPTWRKCTSTAPGPAALRSRSRPREVLQDDAERDRPPEQVLDHASLTPLQTEAEHALRHPRVPRLDLSRRRRHAAASRAPAGRRPGSSQARSSACSRSYRSPGRRFRASRGWRGSARMSEGSRIVSGFDSGDRHRPGQARRPDLGLRPALGRGPAAPRGAHDRADAGQRADHGRRTRRPRGLVGRGR
jgi:hypothetical protein